MRGAGKTTMAKVAASELRCDYVDLDDVMEAKNGGKTCREIIDAVGWDGFRAKEVEILRETLSKEHEGLRVIACGVVLLSLKVQGRSVEVGQENCRVVHIERDIDDIVAYLEASDDSGRRPGYGESVRSVWSRRRPWFADVSTHRFYVCKGDDDWSAVERYFRRFVNHIFGMARGRHETCVHPGTYSICMTSPKVTRDFARFHIRPGISGTRFIGGACRSARGFWRRIKRPGSSGARAVNAATLWHLASIHIYCTNEGGRGLFQRIG